MDIYQEIIELNAMPHETTQISPKTSTDTPDIARLCADALRDLPPALTPADTGLIESCLFRCRQALLHELTLLYTTPEQEDTLREALPPLTLATLPFVPRFAVWRVTLAAVLGLLLALACVQGLMFQAGSLMGERTHPFIGLLSLPAIFLGIGGALWLHHAVRTSLAHNIPVWKKIRPSTLLRWGQYALVLLLCLAILRDFMSTRPALHDILTSLRLFIHEGNALALLGNVYGGLVLVGIFLYSVRGGLYLDKQSLQHTLTLAAHTWWAGATCAAQALLFLEKHKQENHIQQARAAQWRTVGRELYSFAEELPPDKRQWLMAHLHSLGLTSPRTSGHLVWSAELAETYDALGHIEEGDMCYEDMPPLFEDTLLQRKGSVRKVRR